jgi:ABC-type lipoprotein export system ATPase subunit
VLVLPRVIGLVIAMPLLAVVADLVGLTGGALLCHWLLDMPLVLFLERAQDSIAPTTFWVGIMKAPVFALLIALTGTYRGLQVRDSSRELGRLTTTGGGAVDLPRIARRCHVCRGILVARHMSDPIVEVRGLVNRFGAQTVHDGLDMTVERGEVFGIVGGSGSGKSVLLRSILGLQRPQAGEVRLQGRTLNQLNDAELRQIKATYGVTFQQGALFTSLTVLQNVQLPMLEHLRLASRALDELAMLKVRLVGLADEAAGKYPAQLSGGMIKRAALARALALDPGC